MKDWPDPIIAPTPSEAIRKVIMSVAIVVGLYSLTYMAVQAFSPSGHIETPVTTDKR